MAVGATGFGFMGIGVEATKGTSVAATDYIPATSMDGEDATDVLLDSGMRASMAVNYGGVKGVSTASYSAEGDVYVDTIGYFLAAILGDHAAVTTTTTAHTFSLQNSTDGQPPSYTIHDYQGLQARKYAYAMESSLSLRIAAAELFTYSSSWTSRSSVTESAPSPTFSALSPIAGWTGGMTLAGSANALIEEADISFSRNVTPIQTVAGVADPTQIWSGPLSVNGRLMFLAADETEFLRYLAVTSNPILVVTMTQGTASLALTMSKCIYTNAKVERGDDFTQVSVQFEALANTTDAGSSGGYSPIKAVLTNSVSSATNYGV